MAAHFVVLDRPQHGPHVLAVLTTRTDAETIRSLLARAKPHWADLLSIRGAGAETARPNGSVPS